MLFLDREVSNDRQNVKEPQPIGLRLLGFGGCGQT
jgi:hypothetical protein